MIFAILHLNLENISLYSLHCGCKLMGCRLQKRFCVCLYAGFYGIFLFVCLFEGFLGFFFGGGFGVFLGVVFCDFFFLWLFVYSPSHVNWACLFMQTSCQ